MKVTVNIDQWGLERVADPQHCHLKWAGNPNWPVIKCLRLYEAAPGETACSERGGWRREAVNYSCLMPGYWAGLSGLGPVAGRGQTGGRPGQDLSGKPTFVSVGSQTHSSWVQRPGTHLLRPSFLCSLSSASVLGTNQWLDFGFGNYWSYLGERQEIEKDRFGNKNQLLMWALGINLIQSDHIVITVLRIINNTNCMSCMVWFQCLMY